MKSACRMQGRQGDRRSPHGERWIEIGCRQATCRHTRWSLPLTGSVGIEILVSWRPCKTLGCRSPHGERGLKLACLGAIKELGWSLPSRGAWIEIWLGQPGFPAGLVAPLTGSGGLKLPWINLLSRLHRSLPSRGAWIEMMSGRRELSSNSRSRSPHGERGLKISVSWQTGYANPESLPSRGAWIEIGHVGIHLLLMSWSLPSRGAWIEIDAVTSLGGSFSGRSPHGERGLKWKATPPAPQCLASLPSRGSVD